MSELTAADVREALLRLAGWTPFCNEVARLAYDERRIGADVLNEAYQAAAERAAMAAEARAEGER